MLITAALISFIIALATTPFFIRVALKYGLVDDPKLRKHPANTHKGIIPRAGGLPVYCAILITTLLFAPLNKIMIGILLGGFLMLIVGILDDYYDLSAYVRFFLNIAIVALVVMFGLGIPYLTNPLGGVFRLDTLYITLSFFGDHKILILADLFAIIWIVAIANFVNWSKGVDGQMPGFVVIASFFLGLLALRFSAHDIRHESVALFAFIVAGAYAGFLPFNFYPQKIMPGYSGGSLAGFLLGILSILSWGKIGTLILVLSVPIIDAVYVMTRRIVNKKSPFLGDAEHFHHRLLQIGWGKRRIAVFYWIVSFLFGASSLMFERREKLFAFISVFIILAGFIVITDRLKKRELAGQ